MKKLMIALCAAVLGVAANAAQVAWSFEYASYENGDDVATGVTAYLINAATYSLADAYADLKKGEFKTALTLAGQTTSYSEDFGTFVNKTFDASSIVAESSYTIYTVIVEGQEDGDLFAMTATQTMNAPKIGNAQAGFGSLYNDSGDPTYSVASWYEVEKEDPEPTPEPTSAMLMLLGMAGLALRRKQK